MVGVSSLRSHLFRQPWLWGMALAMSLSAVHAVYWSSLRMRAPVVPVVALLAAVGGRQVLQRLSRNPGATMSPRS